ncbi:hypothetical protein SDC9_91930 [bioreactor metagenome]|uniref:Uncharacterized protein n=1 Tax=bioreactor metagenome TaxID=1076179 RepID=A0A645A663_9ZZZZ
MHLVDLFAADELLRVDMPVAMYFRAERFAERVDAAYADAVQAAGDLVAPAAELAARVKHRQRHGERVLARFLMQADRNAAPVVHNGDGVIRANEDFDMRAIARQRLVDGVIDHLGDQMMQPARIGRADVHARAAAHRFQSLQNLNLRRIVCLLVGLFHVVFLSVSQRKSFLGALRILSFTIFKSLPPSGKSKRYPWFTSETVRTATSFKYSLPISLFQRFSSVAEAMWEAKTRSLPRSLSTT